MHKYKLWFVSVVFCFIRLWFGLFYMRTGRNNHFEDDDDEKFLLVHRIAFRIEWFSVYTRFSSIYIQYNKIRNSYKTDEMCLMCTQISVVTHLICVTKSRADSNLSEKKNSFWWCADGWVLLALTIRICTRYLKLCVIWKYACVWLASNSRLRFCCIWYIFVYVSSIHLHGRIIHWTMDTAIIIPYMSYL